MSVLASTPIMTAPSSRKSTNATPSKALLPTSLAVSSGSPDIMTASYGRNFGGSYSNGMTAGLYLSRLVDVSQMDIQSALDQMKSLLLVFPSATTAYSQSQPSISLASSLTLNMATLGPQKVYKMAYYRKQTKNHWARDDPAFVALQIVLLLLSSLVYSIAFRCDSLIYSTLSFSFHSIIVNYVFLGALFATFHRTLANQHLNTGNQMTTGTAQMSRSSSDSAASATMKNASQLHVRQSVEWMYAFDVHCNAFFPLFSVLYVVQFFLLPVVLSKGFLALFISNTLYAVAFSYYFYITHLGFRALPFLSNTEVFLLPVCIVVFVFLLNVVGYPFGFGWNASRIMVHLYFER